VKEIREVQLVTEIKESIEEMRANATKVKPIVERILEEDYDTMEIALGVLNLILKSQSELPEKDELKNFSSRDDERRGDRGRDGKRGDRRDGKRGDKRGDRRDGGRDRNENRGNREGGNYSDRGDRRDRDRGKDRYGDRRDGGRDRRDGGRDSGRGSDPNMVRLFFNGGKKDKIQPKDIVGAIAGETTVPAKAIGEISMLDSFSFIEVDKKYSRDVIEQMKDKRVKGVNVNLEVAKPKERR
jgi:ATP-dependent RNA helicase DeaD